MIPVVLYLENLLIYTVNVYLIDLYNENMSVKFIHQ